MIVHACYADNVDGHRYGTVSSAIAREVLKLSVGDTLEITKVSDIFGVIQTIQQIRMPLNKIALKHGIKFATKKNGDEGLFVLRVM